jgi:hypothetical protein
MLMQCCHGNNVAAAPQSIVHAVTSAFPRTPGCYDWNPQQADGTLNWECADENQIFAFGMSRNDRESDLAVPNTAKPYDQGIVFMEDTRSGPYFKYNYIENINTASPSNTWQALSFASEGNAAGSLPSCGCVACPDKTCNLAIAGPATGALTTDSQYPGNMAFNPQLEVCDSGSGNCMSVNGDACCVGVYSYGYVPQTACQSNCESYWSGISSKRPLSALWTDVKQFLPVFPPDAAKR